MNVVAPSTQVQLLALVTLVVLSGSATARFFMVGDLDKPQRETDVNTTLFTEFIPLSDNVVILSNRTTDVRGQIEYMFGARIFGKQN